MEKPHGHPIRPLHHRLYFRDTCGIVRQISALNHYLQNLLAHNICGGHKRDTWHTSESAQYTRDTLRRRCSRDKTIFTTDSRSTVRLSHGWCHRTWALIARIHCRWSRPQRLDWPMHCGESWSQRHTISWLGADPHPHHNLPVNEKPTKGVTAWRAKW